MGCLGNYCVAKKKGNVILGYLSNRNTICETIMYAKKFNVYDFAVDAMDDLRDANKEEDVLYTVMEVTE